MPRHTERHHIETADGSRLATIIEKPLTDVRGTILFAHCFTCSKDLKSIVRLSRQLTEMGWITCRFDFRGIGQSEGDFSKTNFTTNIEDLQAVCKALDKHGIKVEFLFGHSFGGAASTLAAPEFNQRGDAMIRGVITLAAPSDTAHLADILLRKNHRIEIDGSGDVEIGGKRFTITLDMLNDFRRTDFARRVYQARSHSLVPHLIIHSLSDETVSYAHARELFELLRKTPPNTAFADVSLQTLNGSDHLLSGNPQDLEIVANLVNDWCTQRS